jgi:hypothetical protein
MIEPGLVDDRKAFRVDRANVSPIDAGTKGGARRHNMRDTAIHRGADSMGIYGLTNLRIDGLTHCFC